MTFVLISSSGTMAMAVNMGYRRNRKATAAPDVRHRHARRDLRQHAGVRMDQADWRGRAAMTNPWGAEQFGASFFMITVSNGLHVSIGVIMLVIVATKVLRGPSIAPAITARSRSPACTGISSTSSGSSSSPYFTCGETGHERRALSRHPAALQPGHAPGQQHPIGVYLKVWMYLFVLSSLSYLVDYFDVEGIVRWVLIITFMADEAGMIVAISCTWRGTHGPGLCDPGAAFGARHAHFPDVDRVRLHLLDPHPVPWGKRMTMAPGSGCGSPWRLRCRSSPSPAATWISAW